MGKLWHRNLSSLPKVTKLLNESQDSKSIQPYRPPLYNNGSCGLWITIKETLNWDNIKIYYLVYVSKFTVGVPGKAVPKERKWHRVFSRCINIYTTNNRSWLKLKVMDLCRSVWVMLLHIQVCRKLQQYNFSFWCSYLEWRVLMHIALKSPSIFTFFSYELNCLTIEIPIYQLPWGR